MLTRLILEEDGQDLVEYALLIAFVTLASAALMLAPADSMSRIANKTEEYLSKAQVNSL